MDKAELYRLAQSFEYGSRCMLNGIKMFGKLHHTGGGFVPIEQVKTLVNHIINTGDKDIVEAFTPILNNKEEFCKQVHSYIYSVRSRAKTEFDENGEAYTVGASEQEMKAARFFNNLMFEILLLDNWLKEHPQSLPIAINNDNEPTDADTEREDAATPTEAVTTTIPTKRGKQIAPFSTLNDDGGYKLTALKDALKGKKGKGAALITHCAMKLGWTNTIDFGSVESIMEGKKPIGEASGYTKYKNKAQFTNKEIADTMQFLNTLYRTLKQGK